MGENLRLGVVGTGLIANVVAGAAVAADGVTLAAAASRDLSRADGFLKQFDGGHPFSSWQEMIKSDSIDAVYIACPTALMEEICIAAAPLGKHLLVDKPFNNRESMRRIAACCLDHQVAFMDATHFVHHPRTQTLKAEIPARLGTTQSLHTSFFFPNTDLSNIRFDPTLEPMGAIGDMAWYCMRAAVEYLQPKGAIRQVAASVVREPTKGAVTRVSGLIEFEDGKSTTFQAGWNTGACIMEFELLGEGGLITMNDFVLDWERGFSFNSPDSPCGFTFRTGVAEPKDFEFVATPSEKPAHVLMVEDFAELSANYSVEEANKWVAASEQTQTLVDEIWNAIS